jgi:hypothetical protein
MSSKHFNNTAASFDAAVLLKLDVLTYFDFLIGIHPQ